MNSMRDLSYIYCKIHRILYSFYCLLLNILGDITNNITVDQLSSNIHLYNLHKTGHLYILDRVLCRPCTVVDQSVCMFLEGNS